MQPNTAHANSRAAGKAHLDARRAAIEARRATLEQQLADAEESGDPTQIRAAQEAAELWQRDVAAFNREVAAFNRCATAAPSAGETASVIGIPPAPTTPQPPPPDAAHDDGADEVKIEIRDRPPGANGTQPAPQPASAPPPKRGKRKRSRPATEAPPASDTKPAPDAAPTSPEMPKPPASVSSTSANPSAESEGEKTRAEEQTVPPHNDEQVAADHPEHGLPPLYEARSEDGMCGLWWNKRKKKDGEWMIEPTRLSNFHAAIAVEITEDDGSGNPRKVFEIYARVPGDNAPRTVAIPAEEFAVMNWVLPQLGARARIMPVYGIAGRLRDAIQWFSGKMERRTIYTHTGWRNLNGVWCYLLAGGAILPSGLRRDVSVRLYSRLQHVALPEPPEGDALVQAVRASLALLDVALRAVTIPLVGATYLAPLQEVLTGEAAVDFILALIGATQRFKSELAAQAQAHFGSTFNRVTLPGNFEDTENMHERLLFDAKDVLVVVDDYCPSSRPRKDADAMRLKAARLVRAIGNRACRGRMNQDTTLRADLPPRGLAVITGEEGLSGESTLGRMYPVEIAQGAVKLDRLTEAQRQRPQLALAMSAFLRWLAPQMDELKTTLPAEFVRLRDQARREAGGAARDPGQVAHLYLGFSVFMDFAVSVGAISPEQRQEVLAEAWRVLTARSVARQAEATDENPVERFRAVIRDAFPARRLYVESANGGSGVQAAPQDAERWGWISLPQGSEGDCALRPNPSALMAGWVDADLVYLIPETAKTFVKLQGVSMPWNDLLKRLDEAGAIEARTYKRDDRELRERVLSARIGSIGTKRVVMVRRSWLEANDAEAATVTADAAVTLGERKT